MPRPQSKKRISFKSPHLVRAGVMFLTVASAAAAIIWLASPTDQHLLEKRFEPVELADLNGSVGYAELRPGRPARNYHRLLGRNLTDLNMADQENISPAGQVPRLTPSDPIVDKAVSSVLPPAAPLLAASQEILGAELENHGPRIMAIHPNSPAIDEVPVGALIERVLLRTASNSAAANIETPDSETVLRFFSTLSPGDQLELATDRGTFNIEWPEEGRLGLVLADYLVPVQLPEIDLPTATINPAAGLAVAVALSDSLTSNDLLQGRTVAALARITPDGTLLPLDNPQFRAEALTSDVSLVFVHESQVTYFERRGFNVVGASTLAEVLAALSG